MAALHVDIPHAEFQCLFTLNPRPPRVVAEEIEGPEFLLAGCQRPREIGFSSALPGDTLRVPT